MGAIIVVDALWGDSGKGKVASWLAERHAASVCVRAGTGTNSGHSLYLDDGSVMRTSQIPLAGIMGDSGLWIGSRVAVDPELLEEELSRYKSWNVRSRIKIDMRCPIILPEYRQAERDNAHLNAVVGSTLSGTGYTQAQFVMRSCPQARDLPALAPYISDVAGDVNRLCMAGKTVVVEGSQGTFLSLALSPDYPCCTSGNCTATACADQIGLNWQHIKEVVLVVKAVPSRVGNGPLPGEISLDEQDRRGMAEYGVRTGRRRRKAEGIPWELLRESVLLNGPTQIALTFCDHWDPEQGHSATPTAKVQALIERVETETGVPVTMIDCGKPYRALHEVKTNGGRR